MEHTLKKKTKHLIALRTNNFIETQIEKEQFFGEVLNSLQNNLDQKEFQFLTTYLLFQQNNTNKRFKYQVKTPTQKRIMTQPQQRPFNLSEIDPNLFQDHVDKKDNFLLKKTSIRGKQFDFNCTNTPKRKTKHIVFQNKRIMDLDKKLKEKYKAQKDSIVYSPNILTLEKQNKKNQRFFIKTAYQNSLKKSKSKMQMRRLKTSQNFSRQELTNGFESFQQTKQKVSDFTFISKDKNWRNTEMLDNARSQRFRQSQSSIPKRLMEKVLLSRSYYKFDQSSNDFSDLKLSSRYRDCFS